MSLENLKINDGRHQPGIGDGRFVVYSKYFNALVDHIESIHGTPGTGLFDVINEYTNGAGVTVDGLLLQDGNLDLNNDALATGQVIFDLDGDSYISASADDIVDLYIGAVNTLTFAAGATTVQNSTNILFSGGNLDMDDDTLAQGQVIFDADGDTYMSASADDILQVYVGGVNTQTFSGSQITHRIASNFVGNIIINGAFFKCGSGQIAAGAIDVVNTSCAEFTTTGIGDVYTMADATDGATMRLVYAEEAAGTDTAVVIPTNFLNGTNITFNDLGDYAELAFSDVLGAWYITSLYNAVVVP